MPLKIKIKLENLKNVSDGNWTFVSLARIYGVNKSISQKEKFASDFKAVNNKVTLSQNKSGNPRVLKSKSKNLPVLVL